MLTRGHRQDYDAIRALAGRELRYIGLIGSRAKVAKLVERALEEGCRPTGCGRVHAPVGLDIGAVTPEEIAVSILAELVAVRRGKIARSSVQATLDEVDGARASNVGPRLTRYGVTAYGSPLTAHDSADSRLTRRGRNWALGNLQPDLPSALHCPWRGPSSYATRPFTMNATLDIVEGAVSVRDSRIASVGPEPAAPHDRVIDVGGDRVLPGFVLTHVHLCQTLFGAMPMICGCSIG